MTTQDIAKQEAAYWLQAAGALEKEYPGVFQRVEAELLRTGKRAVDWEISKRVADSYVERFISPENFLAMRAQGPSASPFRFADINKLSQLLGEVNVASNFRLTQQVFSFDPHMAAALVEPEMFKTDSLTDDEGAPLPVDFLMRMPYPTFVIVPNIATIRSILVTSQQVPISRTETALNVQLVVRAANETGRIGSISASLTLRPGQTLRQAVTTTVEEQASTFGQQVDIAHDREVSLRLFEVALPLMLYLCADNRELEGDSAPEPVVSKTKRGPRIFPAVKTYIARAGVRIGTVLRLHQARQAAAESEGGHSGVGMPPHVRRSHWHTFWAGPRNDLAKRRRKLHFLPPIPVNMETPEDLQPVVRPVAA